MPISQAQIPVTALYTRGTLLLPVDTRILEAASVRLESTTNYGNIAFIEIGLMSDGVDQSNRIAVLFSGMVDSNGHVGWTGRITPEPTLHVYANAYTLIQCNVSLTLKTQA